MTEPVYKSLYVLAGKREDGTYGIFRNRPDDSVDCFDDSEQAIKSNAKKVSSIETVVVDIGLLVDQNLVRRGNRIDASSRVKRKE